MSELDRERHTGGDIELKESELGGAEFSARLNKAGG